MRYLLDTNVLSEATKTIPDAQVMALLGKHEDSLATATLVVHELMFGYLRLPPSKRRDTLQNYLENTVLQTFNILSYDQQAAAWHAHERARLSAIGRTPQFVDGQIAAIAYTNHLVLVTRNTNDFENFDGLEVENWFSV